MESEREVTPIIETTETPQNLEAVSTDEKEKEKDPASLEKEDGVQKRINKITADKYAEKQRADLLEIELSKYKKSPLQEEREPSLESLDYDSDKYQEALVDYKINQALSKYSVESAEQAEKDRQTETAAGFAQRVTKAAIPGYEQAIDTLNKSIVLPPDVLNVILSADNGPELAFHLGQNLDVADEIATSQLGIMKLGEISANLKSGAIKKTQLPNAPDPPSSLKTGGAVVSKPNLDALSKLSMDEFMKIKM